MILIAATIAKPTQKSIASTLKPAIDRQLLIANLEEKSIFVLELKWSDEATKIVQLESVGNIDEECYYNGSYIEDPDSTILITGCELKTIQIQSPIFGDYFGTITANGILNVVEDGYLIDDALENPDWNPTSNNVTFPEENNESKLKPTHEKPMADMDCHCEDNDDECWEDCMLIPDYSEENNCEYCEDTNFQCWEDCLKRSDGDEFGSGDDVASEGNNESELKPTHEEPMADMDCHCEDNDDECWEDCVNENRRKKRSDGDECGCGDDDACWENLFQTGECPPTSPEFECGCEDWDKECWKYCLVSTIVDAKETEGTAQNFDIGSLLPQVWGIVKKIFGFDFSSEYALENSEFENEPECECEDGDDNCWLYCLESTITIANLDDYETAQDFSSLLPQIFGIVSKLFGNIFG